MKKRDNGIHPPRLVLMAALAASAALVPNAGAQQPQLADEARLAMARTKLVEYETTIYRSEDEVAVSRAQYFQPTVREAVAEHARREVWAIWGTLIYKEGVKAELDRHAEMEARLRRVAFVANERRLAPAKQRAEALLRRESDRHKAAMTALHKRISGANKEAAGGAQ
jgi:hypothetical protein